MSHRVVLYWNEIQQRMTDLFMESHQDVAWSPNMDVCASDQDVLIRMEASGVKASDVQVHLDGLTLLVTGERRDPYAQAFRTGARMHQLEIVYGSFQRTVMLPFPVQANTAESCMEDGILEIRLKRAMENRHARIPVKPDKRKRK